MDMGLNYASTQPVHHLSPLVTRVSYQGLPPDPCSLLGWPTIPTYFCFWGSDTQASGLKWLPADRNPLHTEPTASIPTRNEDCWEEGLEFGRHCSPLYCGLPNSPCSDAPHPASGCVFLCVPVHRDTGPVEAKGEYLSLSALFSWDRVGRRTWARLAMNKPQWDLSPPFHSVGKGKHRVIRLLVWRWGFELGPHISTAGALTHEAISATPDYTVYKLYNLPHGLPQKDPGES